MTTPAPKTPPSPTPRWKAVKWLTTWFIVTEDEEVAIAKVEPTHLFHPRDPETLAKRIVLAVNEYEGLVAFVRKAAKMFPEGEDSHAVRVEARAILARIEEASR